MGEGQKGQVLFSGVIVLKVHFRIFSESLWNTEVIYYGPSKLSHTFLTAKWALGGILFIQTWTSRPHQKWPPRFIEPFVQPTLRVQSMLSPVLGTEERGERRLIRSYPCGTKVLVKYEHSKKG